ncbi:MAG: hypothetical protein K2K41_04965, partial [Ruminiclostridium sp.]|nr:hypothetical protein [Ruminiclostridium sp.]
ELGYNVPEEFLPQGYGAPVQQDMPNIQNQQFYQQSPQAFPQNGGVQWQPYQQEQQFQPYQQNDVQGQTVQEDKPNNVNQ